VGISVRQGSEVRAVGGGEVGVKHLLPATVKLGDLGCALHERRLVLLVESAQPLFERLVLDLIRMTFAFGFRAL
jgi:hypothetical protein